MDRPRLHFAIALALIAASGLAAAQADEASARLEIQGPPPPLPPEMIARDANNGVTMRATRLKAPLDVDGLLDEPVYEAVPPVGGFIQQVPDEGEPATETTDVWVFFDDENVYVSARCWDSQPERMVANEMRRDNTNISGTTRTSPSSSTRSTTGATASSSTPTRSARSATAVITDERRRSTRLEHGLVRQGGPLRRGLDRRDGDPVQVAALPRRARRSGASTSAGACAGRTRCRYLTRDPGGAGAPRGISKVSSAATLVGIEAPSGSLNLELKPYVIARRRRPTSTPSRAFEQRLGRRLRRRRQVRRSRRSLTADLTYNTDFAQVEDDEQQVNLTRFSLFFPEKREFFLEGTGIFDFGSALLADEAPDLRPVVFFSRRIGLSELGPVPIRAGGRVTGKTGPYGVGTLYIQTDEDGATQSPRTSFATLRVKRDVLRRGTVGVIGTRRSPATSGEGVNEVLGADAQLKFFTYLWIEGYYAATRTGGRRGDGDSHQLRVNYRGDLYGLDLEHLVVGEDFNTDIGFVPRPGIERRRAQARFSPRPQAWKDVRKIGLTAELDYITDRHGRLETRDAELRFDLELENSDALSATYARHFEFLPEDFPITADVVIPSGEYRFDEARLTYELGGQRKISGFLSAATGGFYDGTRTSAGYTGRVGLTRASSSSRAFSSTGSTCPPGPSPPSSTAAASATPSRRGCSSRRSCSTTPRPVPSTPTCAGAGSTRRAATCSSSTRTEGTRPPRVFPTVRNQTFVVKLTKLFRF